MSAALLHLSSEVLTPALPVLANISPRHSECCFNLQKSHSLNTVLNSHLTFNFTLAKLYTSEFSLYCLGLPSFL